MSEIVFSVVVFHVRDYSLPPSLHQKIDFTR